MKIHEYQAKEILRRYGVATPRGRVTDDPDEARRSARSWAAGASSRRRSTPAAAARAAASSSPSRPRRRASTRRKILGMQLVTHQTGPEGQLVRKVLIEEAADIAQELYLAITARPRPGQAGGHGLARPAAWTSRRWRRKDPKAISPRGDRSASRHHAVPGPRAWPAAWASSGETAAKARQAGAGAGPRLPRHRRLARRDQPADGHRRRRRDGARRQDELRRQRPLPPPGRRGDARPRRGEPARGRGLASTTSTTSSSTATSPAWSTAPAWRWRRWTSSSSTAASRPTSSTSAAAPARRRSRTPSASWSPIPTSRRC